MGLLRKGLAQMLISDLSGSDRFQIVERDRLQEILDELKLNETKQIDKGSANRIGKLLGARYMVLGGYFDLMGSLRVDARVVEVETGKVIKSVGGTSLPDEFLDLQQRILGRPRQGVDESARRHAREGRAEDQGAQAAQGQHRQEVLRGSRRPRQEGQGHRQEATRRGREGAARLLPGAARSQVPGPMTRSLPVLIVLTALACRHDPPPSSSRRASRSTATPPTTASPAPSPPPTCRSTFRTARIRSSSAAPSPARRATSGSRPSPSAFRAAASSSSSAAPRSRSRHRPGSRTA